MIPCGTITVKGQYMPDVVIININTNSLAELQTELVRNGFTCTMTDYCETVAEDISQQSPYVVLAEVNRRQPGRLTQEYINEIKLRNSLPVIALLTGEIPEELGVDWKIDDFVVSPFNIRELSLRINRVIKKEVISDNSETIIYNGLVIDLAKCEVSVDGIKADLTFKEYEVLRFLAGNSGRVLTRDVLLDKIWGMDYFGGDRTVDVHIRRLRSKIEKPGKIFIETVRNIGYRFRND